MDILKDKLTETIYLWMRWSKLVSILIRLLQDRIAKTNNTPLQSGRSSRFKYTSLRYLSGRWAKSIDEVRNVEIKAWT